MKLGSRIENKERANLNVFGEVASGVLGEKKQNTGMIFVCEEYIALF